MFKKLPSLVTVDLQRNKLQTIAHAFIFGPNFTDLFLLGTFSFIVKFFDSLKLLKSIEIIQVLKNLYVLIIYSGNQWDCTKTMKWLLEPKHANLITDLQFLKCSDQKYRGRPICTVMEYKKVSFSRKNTNLKLNFQSYK